MDASMMRFSLILLTLFLFTSSCTIKEKPEFLRIGRIEIVETTPRNITLKAEAFFNNPNNVGGELWTDDIKIFINDMQMAQISSEAFKVPAKSEFSVPLKAKIATDSLLSDKGLSGLLGSLLSQKMKVQYLGDIKYKIFGLSHRYSVDKTEQIKIKF